MGKKRIHRKPVALTFADTSNQQDVEGCSSWTPRERERNQGDGKGSTHQRHENGDEDEIECVGMVSSSTTSTDNQRNNRPSNRELLRRQKEEEEERIRQREEEDFQRAIELSRQDMQVTSVTNSTSDSVISNEDSEGEDRVQTNNGVGGESDEGSSGLEDALEVHGEAQAQTSKRSSASRENTHQGIDGSSDGEDSDVTDISDEEEEERGGADEAGCHMVEDVDEEGNGDDDDTSVSSSILDQSDEEEITPGQQPKASSSYPTQSSNRAVAKVGPLEGRDSQEGSIDIFEVMEEQDEPSQELFVDSQRSYQGYEPQPESTHSQEEERGGSSTADSRRTRLSLRKRKRDGEESSEPRTNNNRTKAPRLAQEPDSEGSEVDVEVQSSDDDNENSNAPPSQDPGFIDFPQRFPDNAGVPLVDHRKPNHKSPFLTPPGVVPNAYTAVILRLFCQYKLRLLKAQAKQRHRIELGKPVMVGPHVKDTIVHKKRGQKVFQWQLSSDEENAGNSQENDPEASNQARLVKPLGTELGHLSKVFHNNSDANIVKTVTGKQQAEARPAGFKPKVEWTRSVSGSSGVQNNARTTGSVSLKTADEVSSSRALVSKVSPVQKSTGGEWISKSDMSEKREVKIRRLSSSDESDADVEVVPGNTTKRTPLTATVSPRRSTPAESQSSSSLRSPVFAGKSSRGLVRLSSGVTRQVGHCSPRTVQSNRDKMESPQPSSPRLRVDNDVRPQVTIVAESASGVSSTVPDNAGRHTMPSLEQHQEATASESVSSVVPTLGTGADSAADPARTCPTSTNHAEQGGSSDAAPAISRLASSSVYAVPLSFEEERFHHYTSNQSRDTHPEENGVGNVGSSSVNRPGESNNDESKEEGIVHENSLSHECRQTNGAVHTNERDDAEHLHERNGEDGEENEVRSVNAQDDEQVDQDTELQNSNEAAVSIGTNSSIAEIDDNILEDRGGPRDEDDRQNVEPARRNEEDDGEAEVEVREDGGDEPEADGVQCPLCGVMFAMTVIEVHAAECNGPVANAEPARPEPRRRPPRPVPGPGPARPANPQDRMVARMEMLDRTSSEDEGDADDVMVTEAQETSRPARKQNVRKRTFPSSENTSDSPTSSVGSMSHFDNVVLGMVQRNEIKVTAPGPSSTSRQADRNPPAHKRAKWQSKTTSSHAVDSDEDSDTEAGEVEKCFICNQFILKSKYQQHVQHELDQMDASNNSLVESTSSTDAPSRNTRQSAALGNENGGDAVPSAVSTSTASTRRQTSAAVGGLSSRGVSHTRRGDTTGQGTRAKRAVNLNGGEATSTSQLRSGNRELSSDEESGPNSPSALDAFLVDSDDDGEDDNDDDDDDEADGEERVVGDPSMIPFSDSPIKAFKSLKHNQPCLIDFKNQFNTSGGEKSPRKFTSRGAGGRGSGQGRRKGKGKWKSGKKWGGVVNPKDKQ